MTRCHVHQAVDRIKTWLWRCWRLWRDKSRSWFHRRRHAYRSQLHQCNNELNFASNLWLNPEELRDTSATDRGKVETLRTKDNSDETQLHRWFGLNLVPSVRTLQTRVPSVLRHQFCGAEVSCVKFSQQITPHIMENLIYRKWFLLFYT